MNTDTIVRVDPSTLLVGPNVRKDVAIGKEFVASIKQHGVRVPISVQETEAGLEVIDGQRRTLAAVDAGLAEVPAFVMTAEKDAARIIDQLIVNEHRAGISDADQVAAIRELSLFDMPAQTIARKVGMSKAIVQSAIAVGSSERAVSAMRGAKPVTFEVAATIAEFEGDEEAQADLAEKAAKGYYIDHVAQEWRDKRGIAAAAERIKEAGLILIERPSYQQKDPIEVRELFLDKECTKRLGDLPDDEMKEIAGDGLCAFPATLGHGDERQYSIVYAVKGWEAKGLHTHSWRLQGPTKPTTPEEAEKQKEERRVARETTKAWVSASAVRLRFLQELVARRTPPKGWERVVGQRLLTSDSFPNAGWKMAIAILQLTEETHAFSQRGVVEKHFAESPKPAQIMLAAALGAIEGGYDFERKGWEQKETAAYLKQLVEWGYELSELEQKITKQTRRKQ